MALFIPAAAWLGDRFGPRQVLLGSIALFTAASALCGLAGSLDELVAFRVLQGVGGGLMTPVGLTMLFRAFPQAERVRASAILVIPTALAPAVGPVIGGLFVTDVSWRWVFYVNVPVGLFALVFGVLFLADQDHPAAGRFDVPGLRDLQPRARPADVRGGRGTERRVDGGADRRLHHRGRAAGRGHGGHRAADAGAPARPAGLRRPAVPLGQHRADPDVGAFFGLLFLLSLFFQDGLHFSALQAGSTICPEAFGVIIASQLISRRIYPAIGPRRIMVAGLLLIAASPRSCRPPAPGPACGCCGPSCSSWASASPPVFLPSQAAGFATVGAARTSVASTVFNAQRHDRRGDRGGPAHRGHLRPPPGADGRRPPRGQHPRLPHRADVCAGVAVAAALAALTVRDRDAAPTMIRPRRPSPADAAALPGEGATAASTD